MNKHKTIGTNARRVAEGLTLRMDADTLAVLDLIKEQSGMSKGKIVSIAINYWFGNYYKPGRNKLMELRKENPDDNKQKCVIPIATEVTFVEYKE